MCQIIQIMARNKNIYRLSLIQSYEPDSFLIQMQSLHTKHTVCKGLQFLNFPKLIVQQMRPINISTISRLTSFSTNMLEICVTRAILLTFLLVAISWFLLCTVAYSNSQYHDQPMQIFSHLISLTNIIHIQYYIQVFDIVLGWVSVNMPNGASQRDKFNHGKVYELVTYNQMKKNEQKQNRKRLNSQSALQKLPPLSKKATVNEKPSLTNITHQDEGIIGLLYEYFIKNNFMDSLDSFQRDCQEKGFKPNNKFIESFRDEIIDAFDQGSRDIFMVRFGQFVPISMRNKDTQTMKLEFYIQVYFFVYSIHPQLGKKRAIDSSSKQSFINYLQGKGAGLAKSQQFLQYYALAYLQKPQQHPTFKTIFTKEWISELKKQLLYFIEKLYPSGKSPLIISIYDKFIEKNMEKNSEQSITEPDDELEIEEQIEQEESIVMNNQLSSRAQENVPRYHSLRNNNAFENTDREKESMSLKIAELEEEKSELIKFIEGVKNKYQSLQNNYKDFTDAAQNTLMESQSKWFKITQEFYNMASSLRDICTKMQNNQSLDDPSVIQKISKKLSKYESFVKMNIEDLISENVDFSLFERPDHDLSVDMVRKNNQDRPQFYIQLDFEKIKTLLSNNSPDKDLDKCFLLDALRARINKTRGALMKREVILSFVLNDIFYLKKKDSDTLKNLLSSTNQAVITKTMQFFNALTKDYFGRNYLSCENVVNNAMTLLHNEKLDDHIVVITVSFLQQLSVRKNAQEMMIQGQMIKWIITKLRNERETMSWYLMQYSLATIINLLLKKSGLEKSQQIKQEILKTLIDLMEIDMIEIREYVHGAIYPLFNKKVFRDKAKEYGLQANIKFLLENTESEYLIKQLNYLAKQLMREDDNKEEQNQNEEEEDMDEIYDEEFGEDLDFEVEIQEATGLSGEELLMKMYPLTGPDAIKQMNMIREEAEITLKNKSIYVASNFSERPSTNNPKIGMRKNISNNNSVYSNKSSNRVLKSELMNRSQLNKNQPKDRLDTVHPDNSEKEMSIKDFIEDNSDLSGEQASQKQSRSRRKQQNELEGGAGLKPGRNSEPNILENGSFHQGSSSRPQRPLKPYQTTQQYRSAFVATKGLPRTPPQK